MADYRVIVLSFKEALLSRKTTIHKIAVAYGLYQPTLAKTYTLMRKEGILGKRKKHWFRNERAKKLELFLTKHRGQFNMAEIARQFNCSREYIRQVKNRLVLSGKIKVNRKLWD
jgi:DNA-binding IscR family transcriptional regulator